MTSVTNCNKSTKCFTTERWHLCLLYVQSWQEHISLLEVICQSLIPLGQFLWKKNCLHCNKLRSLQFAQVLFFLTKLQNLNLYIYHSFYAIFEWCYLVSLTSTHRSPFSISCKVGLVVTLSLLFIQGSLYPSFISEGQLHWV